MSSREYSASHPHTPRFIRGLIERERELAARLSSLEHEGLRLSGTQIARLLNLYRTLTLLTTHETLADMKRFYERMFSKRRIRAGDEEFTPVHGPIITSMVDDFRLLREVRDEEEYGRRAEEIAAGYEPLLFIGGYLRMEVARVLNTEEKEIPRERHEAFIRNVERIQMRRPLRG